MAWDRKTLEECTEYITDGDHQPAPKSDDGVLFIKIKDIKDSRVDFKEALHVPLVYYEGIQRNRKPVLGDTLYTVVGSYGLSAYVNFDIPFCFERNIALLHPKKGVDSRFLFYSVNTPDFFKQAENAANGAAQKLIPLSRLKQLKIQVPPFATQKKIADILSAYDDLIENNQKQIKLLEETAQRLYKQWFIDLRFPGHETTPIVDGLPEGWNYRPVNSIVSLLSGFAFKSGTFSENGQYKIVTIKNVQDGTFDGENVSLVDDIPPKMPTHCILNDGDILLSLTGNVGRVCMVVGEKYLLNQRVAKIKSDYPSFTYCMFRSKDMYDEMNNLANGAAQQNLSPIRTGEIKIAVPPSDILELFENEVNPIIAKILLLNKQNKSLSQSRDRLLPKLMNGEI